MLGNGVLGSSLHELLFYQSELLGGGLEISGLESGVEVLQNGLQMILDSSVSGGLLVDDSDSFLCGFDVCHKNLPHFSYFLASLRLSGRQIRS